MNGTRLVAPPPHMELGGISWLVQSLEGLRSVAARPEKASTCLADDDEALIHEHLGELGYVD